MYLAGSQSRWRYCEGCDYPARFGLAIPHAWLINDCGGVLATAWCDANAAYLGIPFYLADVSAAMAVEATSLLRDGWVRDVPHQD